MPLKWKWPKYSKIFKDDQNTLKPKNDQNISKTQKMIKIPSKAKKWPKYPQNPKNDQNTLETQKILVLSSFHLTGHGLRNWNGHISGLL